MPLFAPAEIGAHESMLSAVGFKSVTGRSPAKRRARPPEGHPNEMAKAQALPRPTDCQAEQPASRGGGGLARAADLVAAGRSAGARAKADPAGAIADRPLDGAFRLADRRHRDRLQRRPVPV